MPGPGLALEAAVIPAPLAAQPSSRWPAAIGCCSSRSQLGQSGTCPGHPGAVHAARASRVAIARITSFDATGAGASVREGLVHLRVKRIAPQHPATTFSTLGRLWLPSASAPGLHRRDQVSWTPAGASDIAIVMPAPSVLPI